MKEQTACPARCQAGMTVALHVPRAENTDRQELRA
jgi:hypothetical protein